jgi:hypothetical protein
MNGKPRTRKGSIKGNFVAHTREMRESAAWRNLPDNARRVLDRLEVEHMRHGGAENGHLKCTYKDFEASGLRRASVSLAIRQAVALGFLKVPKRGGRSISDLRTPSEYFLTYVEGWKRSGRATHDWSKIESDAEAQAALALAEVQRNREGQAKARNPKKPDALASPEPDAETRLERSIAGRENATPIAGRASEPPIYISGRGGRGARVPVLNALGSAALASTPLAAMER